MRIVTASEANIGDIERILLDSGLPTAGVRDRFPAGYAVATDGVGVVGCAGLEDYGRSGLLRSVAVMPSHRGTGVGRALVTDRIATARALRLDSVFLLTTTAPDYFVRHGFTRTDRGRAPAAVAACPEFSSICATSAICLLLDL